MSYFLQNGNFYKKLKKEKGRFPDPFQINRYPLLHAGSFQSFLHLPLLPCLSDILPLCFRHGIHLRNLTIQHNGVLRKASSDIPRQHHPAS